MCIQNVQTIHYFLFNLLQFQPWTNPNLNLAVYLSAKRLGIKLEKCIEFYHRRIPYAWKPSYTDMYSNRFRRQYNIVLYARKPTHTARHSNMSYNTALPNTGSVLWQSLVIVWRERSRVKGVKLDIVRDEGSYHDQYCSNRDGHLLLSGWG